MNSNKRGFTLIELMIVVVIAAIIAVIAIPSYQLYIARSFASQAQAEMHKLSERLESYRGKQLTFAGFIPDKQVTGQKGVIYLPYDSSATNFNYQVIVVDITDNTKSLEESITGQGWRMVAIPNQTKGEALRKSKSFLLDSRGNQCESDTLLTSTSISC